MSFVWEFIAVWREQYYAMVRIQFPEFFRSIVLLISTFLTSLPVSKEIPESSYGDGGKSEDKIECEVLYDPPQGQRRGDIIIVHGLHGSTYKTWRQGVYDDNKVEKLQLRRHLPLAHKKKCCQICSKCKLYKKSLSCSQLRNNGALKDNTCNPKNGKRFTSSQCSCQKTSSVDDQDVCKMDDSNKNDTQLSKDEENKAVHSKLTNNQHADKLCHQINSTKEIDIFDDKLECYNNLSHNGNNNIKDILNESASSYDDNCCIFRRSNSTPNQFCPESVCDSILEIRSNNKINNFKGPELEICDNFNDNFNCKIPMCNICSQTFSTDIKNRPFKSYERPPIDFSEKIEIYSANENFSILNSDLENDCLENDNESEKELDFNSVFEVTYQNEQAINKEASDKEDFINFIVNDVSKYNGYIENNEINMYQNRSELDRKSELMSDAEQFCICGEEEMKKECEHNEINSYENYLKYKDAFGNSPLVLREFIYFVKFFLNFAKEICSLYKKLWDFSEDKNLSSCWPRDWIPTDCPYTRVISVNYTTFLWMPIWARPCNRSSLQEKSLRMARQLESLGVGEYPVVWAAHSKGGLFIKQIFVNSWRECQGVSNSLFLKTKSIVFYSVPQHGSILAHLFTPPLVKPSVEIVEIRTGSQMVLKLNNEFREALQAADAIRDIHAPLIVRSYTETIPTNMSGVLLQIVFPTSADPGVGELYGIPLDHRMICKFASKNSLLYKELIALIENACGEISQRSS